MSDEIRQEWLNRNAGISFPLTADSDMSCSNGVVFPNSILLDMRVCFFGLSAPDVSLVSAVIREDRADLTFRCGERTFSVDGSGMVKGASDDMSFMAYIADVGVLKEFVGSYPLLHPARIVPERVVDIRYGIGVDTLSCEGGSAIGEVNVADGYNTELDIHGNSLRLRIGDGLGKGTKCIKHSGDYACNGSVLYYLNGQKAGLNGSIAIQGGNGVKVSSGTYKGIPAIIVETDESVNGFLYK